MIVVDASAWVLALVDAGPTGDATRQILSADPDWIAPAQMPIEVLRTIRRYEQTGVVDRGAADGFAAEVMAAEVRYALPDTAQLRYVWRQRHNVSAYDAPYLALAARYGISVVTNDQRLARAASGLDIEAVVPRHTGASAPRSEREA